MQRVTFGRHLDFLSYWLIFELRELYSESDAFNLRSDLMTIIISVLAQYFLNNWYGENNPVCQNLLDFITKRRKGNYEKKAPII